MFSKRTRMMPEQHKKDQKKESKYDDNIIPHAPIPNYITTTKKLVAYLQWDKSVLASIQGYTTPLGYSCYTSKFFHELKNDYGINLKQYLAPCNTTLQLGAWTGKFLKQMPYIVRTPKNQTHVTIGYDYSLRSIECLQANGITKTRQVDLNSVTKVGEETQLAYLDQLKEDLRSKANILAIRIFEYLNPETVPLLMCALMDFAQPGSTFIFIGRAPWKTEAHAIDEKSEQKNKDKVVPIDCMSRFFRRQDIRIIDSAIFTPQFDSGQSGEELLVAQKIDSSQDSESPRRLCKI